jgi:hypothetical protein
MCKTLYSASTCIAGKLRVLPGKLFNWVALSTRLVELKARGSYYPTSLLITGSALLIQGPRLEKRGAGMYESYR